MNEIVENTMWKQLPLDRITHRSNIEKSRNASLGARPTPMLSVERRDIGPHLIPPANETAYDWQQAANTRYGLPPATTRDPNLVSGAHSWIMHL